MIPLLLACSLAGLEDLYRQGNYEAVVEVVPAFLADSAGSRLDSVRAYELSAFSQTALGKTEAAAMLFRQALTLKPDLTLDPREVSPKIIAVFEPIRRETQQAATPVKPARTDTVRVRQPVPISVLLPGVNQLQQGNTAKGSILLAAGALSLGALVVTEVGYETAHHDYLQATAPSEIISRYQTANKWYRARSITVGTTALTWLYSLLDAVLSR